ncbi:D-2-hydroxyacid dehydrogenase [Caldalkalibacillus salinus]|uniref:D-2-hydroxyacid dehydrogenase n=1 Tax=Caldalkalibacillus salinus TaxID=2803787 RepID=UPI0019222C40|nr:D-2-hydroxyacid dehydrogenase [Caldalkalibacillus salinus]
MKIVVLDGYTLNPGDLSWQGLEHLGDVTVYDRTSQADIIPRAKEANLILTNKTPISAETIQACPKLKYIGVLATGFDQVDIHSAIQHEVVVTNIPTYGTASVAQFTFALLLSLAHRVQKHSDAVHAGQWSETSDFSFWLTPQIELQGKTMGIIGYGAIGEQVGKIANVMGMNVMAYRRSPGGTPPYERFEWATDLDQVFKCADIVSLHCPLTTETEGMINRHTLSMMKKEALLLNTARGKLIVEEDLAKALDEKRIAGAALDVLSTEPPQAEHPLYGVKNCIMTPHMAWASVEARTRLMNIAVNNAYQFLQGDPINVVNR